MAVGAILRATAFNLILLACWTPLVSTACDPGWFGLKCQYQCHCADTACGSPCLLCERGWFGPDCQYVDWASHKKSSHRDSSLITDGDDDTCLVPTGSRRGGVVVDLGDYYPFTWLRVRVSDSGQAFLHNLTFGFNSKSCLNPRNASVNNTTLDFYCVPGELVRSVTLTGAGINYLCSVYISGGRNVALRQTTSQSTTYFENSTLTHWKNVSFISSRAVDGNISQDVYNSDSCSSTYEEVKPMTATFNVTFSEPQIINFFVIYYRKYENYRRRSFLLQSFDESNSLVFNHTCSDTDYSDVCTFTAGGVTRPISHVKIEATNYKNVLLFCEVQIFGDSACKPGQFGRDCEHTCHCVADERCFVSTGGCPSGCAPGFYGASCDQSEADVGTSALSIVGAVVGVILVVLLVVIILVLLRKWKKMQPKQKLVLQKTIADGNRSMTGSDLALVEVGQRTPTPVRATSAKHSATAKGGTDKWKEENKDEKLAVYSNTVCEQSTTALSIKELADFVKSKDRAFFQNQFNKIPVNLSATMSVALSPENAHKNRYKNISAYDHSRVHLIPDVDKKQEDYINASYIEGYSSGECFIASQGPSKSNLEDFIRMLWEQKVDKVVMLTNLVEEGKQKCELYWPEDGEMQVGEITVQLAITQVFADYTIRRLKLKKQGQPTQNVTHFHFTTWPDKNIPTGPWGLVDFEQRVASYPTSKPIVVHCSAGVGRTGTFIALRNVMRQAEETGHMDFFTTVQKLRHDRVNMVQTIDQYIFLHKAAIIAMVCMGTTVTIRDIQNRNQTFGTKSEQTKMAAEFKAICRAQDHFLEESSAESSSYIVDEQNQNNHKNRFSSILPNGLYRAVLQCENPSLGGYINAVLVPSFTKRNHQILTQLPLPETTVDFWRLIIQYKVTLVVAFELDLKSTDPTVIDYLSAAENQPASFSMLKLGIEPVNTRSFWKQDKVCLTLDKDQINNLEEHHLTHLTCTTTNPDPGCLLDLIEQIRSLQLSSRGRILYTCRDGATYSGLVCVLSLLLDRMDNDQRLTVPLVVGAMKAVRPEIVPTLEQYSLLYQVLQLYSDNKGTYSNFGSTTS